MDDVVRKVARTIITDTNGRDLALEENGGLPCNIQDQTTRAFDIKMYQVIDDTLSLASSPTVDTYTVTLTTGHGLTGGEKLAIIEQDGMPQLYFGLVLGVAGDVITLDTPIPYSFDYTVADVFSYTSDFNVNGSVTPQIFRIVNLFTQATDTVRIIFSLLDSTVMDDAKFGGQTALTRGLVLRKKHTDGTFINYWNVKTNGELGELAFDKLYAPKAPAGQYGLTVRLSYGGQSKHGVVIRLEQNEELQLVVQDDLTGITSASLMTEGHFTQD